MLLYWSCAAAFEGGRRRDAARPSVGRLKTGQQLHAASFELLYLLPRLVNATLRTSPHERYILSSREHSARKLRWAYWNFERIAGASYVEHLPLPPPVFTYGARSAIMCFALVFTVQGSHVSSAVSDHSASFGGWRVTHCVKTTRSCVSTKQVSTKETSVHYFRTRLFWASPSADLHGLHFYGQIWKFNLE